VKPSFQPLILLIGHDPALVYLLGRFAERSGYQLLTSKAAPSVEEVYALQPAAILFTSLQTLELAQPFIAGLTGGNIPLLVCAAVADQARALDLGVDGCLLHPLTCDDFLTTLTALHHSRGIIED
jgi:hypothetical protein